ncbi:hypothetical protein RQP46_002113 [Phenoliferia psychrophenolica]
MVPSITAASLLDALPSGADPFAFLSHRLEGELFTKTPPQIRRGMYALSALMGLTLLANIVGLVLKVSRGDRWLYKRQERPQGTLILPNTVLNFVRPRFPLFFELELQLPPIILNSFFVAGLVTAPIALIATTALRTVSWNKGVAAFVELDAALKEWTGNGGDVRTVVDVIPNCDALLHTMTVNFYRWAPPWEVCAAFAMLSGLVMAVACWIQTRILRRQINQVSMFAYFCVCFLGNLYVAATPIFKISKSRSTHSYIILFGYTVIDAIVVSIQSASLPSKYSQVDVTLRANGREGGYHELDHFTATPPLSKISRLPVPNEKTWPPSPGSPGWLPEYPGTPVEAHLRKDSPTHD